MDGRLSRTEWLAQRMPVTDQWPAPGGRRHASAEQVGWFDPEPPSAALGLQCTHTVYMPESQYAIYGLSGRNPIGLLSLDVVFLRRTLIYVILIRMESNGV
jgi:hypothetical protein